MCWWLGGGRKGVGFGCLVWIRSEPWWALWYRLYLVDLLVGCLCFRWVVLLTYEGLEVVKLLPLLFVDQLNSGLRVDVFEAYLLSLMLNCFQQTKVLIELILVLIKRMHVLGAVLKHVPVKHVWDWHSVPFWKTYICETSSNWHCENFVISKPCVKCKVLKHKILRIDTKSTTRLCLFVCFFSIKCRPT